MAVNIDNVIVDENGCRMVTTDPETGEETESKMICSVPVDITAIEADEERGRRYYVVELGGPLSTQVRVPTGRGAAGIARAVANAGAWINSKLLVEYIDALIASKWHDLMANQQASNSDDSDPGAISVYEQFLMWVDANITNFDSGVYGTIEEKKEYRRIRILPPIFSTFLSQVGVRGQQERRSVLNYWKKMGWLRVQDSNDEKFSITVRVGSRTRRMYEIVEELVSVQRNIELKAISSA
jgi:hypothetical protein